MQTITPYFWFKYYLIDSDIERNKDSFCELKRLKFDINKLMKQPLEELEADLLLSLKFKADVLLELHCAGEKIN